LKIFDLKEENASSFKDEAEVFENSLLSKVIRISKVIGPEREEDRQVLDLRQENGEGRRPEPREDRQVFEESEGFFDNRRGTLSPCWYFFPSGSNLFSDDLIAFEKTLKLSIAGSPHDACTTGHGHAAHLPQQCRDNVAETAGST
jgi:hypothetical protein